MNMKRNYRIKLYSVENGWMLAKRYSHKYVSICKFSHEMIPVATFAVIFAIAIYLQM